MVLSRDQNTRRSHNIKIDNNFFVMVEEFRYFGTALTNHNCIQEKIKSGLKSGNACCHFGAESFVFQFAIQNYKD
jgi:hypothetical protein